MEHYDSRFEMCLNYKKDIMEKQVQFIDSLAIDDNVKINTGFILMISYSRNLEKIFKSISET